MMLPYLVKIAESNKFSEVVSLIDAPPLDMNLLIWDSIDASEIEVDEEKDRIKVLTEDVQPWSNPDIANKIVRTVQHYAQNNTNITRGRLNGQFKDPITGKGYPAHEFFMTIEALIDTGTLVQDVIDVPGVKGKRQPHKFAFLGLPENADKNAEWNAKVVNKWIDDVAKQGNKKVN